MNQPEASLVQTAGGGRELQVDASRRGSGVPRMVSLGAAWSRGLGFRGLEFRV